jgi:hypothetical protein
LDVRSILAETLTQRLRKIIPSGSSGPSEFSVVEIFTHPTLRDLVSLLHDKIPTSEQFKNSLPSVFPSPNPTSRPSAHKLESEVLNIWKVVLKTADSLPTSVNFFDVGGNR